MRRFAPARPPARSGLCTTLLATALLLGACSSSDEPGPAASIADATGPVASGTDPGAGATGPSGPTSAAADAVATVGVTDDAVHVVVLQVDPDSVSGLGIDTSTDVTVEQAVDALLAPVNDAGGIAGRRIDVSYVEFNPIDAAAQRAACLAATEDQETFVVLVPQGFFGDSVLCVVEQHETLFMEGDGFPPEFYERAEGRLFSTVAAKGRALSIAAERLDDAGLLDGTTIGVLGSDDLADAESTDVLVDELARLGHEPAHVTRLTTDLDAMQAQVPAAVEAMRAAGVDTVFNAHNVLAAGQFATEADEIGWRPLWLESDNAQGVSDLAIALMPPEAFDGALGVTATLAGTNDAGEPETEANAACRTRIEEATGVTLTRVNEDGNEPPAYANTMILCNLVDTLVAGLEGAGPDLDQASFIAAVEARGEFPLAAAGGPGSFTSDKHDAPDAFRLVHFSADCGCWVPDGPFQRVE